MGRLKPTLTNPGLPWFALCTKVKQIPCGNDRQKSKGKDETKTDPSLFRPTDEDLSAGTPCAQDDKWFGNRAGLCLPTLDAIRLRQGWGTHGCGWDSKERESTGAICQIKLVVGRECLSDTWRK